MRAFARRPDQAELQPTLGGICITIAWATTYAVEELNETHPVWPDYFAYSEWFRHRICTRLGLPLNTEWMVIYKRVGCVIQEEYASEKEFRDAFHFGETHFLDDELAPAMLDRFEEIKFKIVKRY